jgi:hypothetical protein
MAADGGLSGADGGDADGGVACAFDHALPLGAACNATVDCADGPCIPGELGTVCSRRCDTAACPTGFLCVMARTGLGSQTQQLCVLEAEGPVGTGLADGTPCAQSAQCATPGSTCAYANDGTRFCAPPCLLDADCGACGRCADFSEDEGRFCVPRGAGAIGARCERRHDCESFECEAQCTQDCSDGELCPALSECVPIAEQQGRSVCLLPSNQGALADGERCSFNIQCVAPSRCLTDATLTLRCAKPIPQGEPCRRTEECAEGLRCIQGEGTNRSCQPPGPPGARCDGPDDCAQPNTCRNFSGTRLEQFCSRECTADADCGPQARCFSVDQDTYLFVYADPDDPSPLAYNVDIGRENGDTWSRVVLESLPAGVAITAAVGNQSYSIGAYALSVRYLDDVGPGTAVQEAEQGNQFRNDVITLPQVLDALPVTVSGLLDSQPDVDHFRFTTARAGTVVLETGGGPPSACMAAGLLGVGQLGDACTFNAQCASDRCKQRLGICGQDCATTEDCGASGFTCASLGTRLTCLPLTQTGGLATGELCQFDFECEGGLCAQFDRVDSNTVRQMCAVPCGAQRACPMGLECADTPTGPACLPPGEGGRSIGLPCVRQSDCAMGLGCDDNRCTKPCTVDADCPHQDYPRSFPADTGCQSCTSVEDCGEAGFCERGVGLEQYCLEPCCPPGFDCSAEVFRCFPPHGSCRAPRCIMGRCDVPPLSVGEPCLADDQCVTAHCGPEGLCSETCTTTCGCGSFECNAGECVLAPAREVEPNGVGAAPTAMPAGFPSSVVGVLAGGSPRDVDRYAVTLAAGTRVRVGTSSLCRDSAPGLDTAVRVVRDGLLVMAGEIPNGHDVLVLDVTAGGPYVVEVRAGPGTPEARTAYVLTVESQP